MAGRIDYGAVHSDLVEGHVAEQLKRRVVPVLDDGGPPDRPQPVDHQLSHYMQRSTGVSNSMSGLLCVASATKATRQRRLNR